LVLSVPLTVCLVVLGSHVPSLEFLNVLLGDQPVMEPGAHYYQRLLANDQREASQVLEAQLRSTSLEALYDHVLIPALSLSELDRHRNALDESTVSFITVTTKDLVEEYSMETLYVGEKQRKIVCLPVRDDADEIVGIMLAQLLGRAGYAAVAVSIGSVEGMLAEVAKAEAEVICLSALPPYAISHARGLYKKLRARHPQVPIIIGLWNYSDDPVKAAQEISGGEQKLVCTTLAQTVVQVGLAPPDTLEPLVSPAMP
jgi:methanogenic corrinoid protein MtbC1